MKKIEKNDYCLNPTLVHVLTNTSEEDNYDEFADEDDAKKTLYYRKFLDILLVVLSKTEKIDKFKMNYSLNDSVAFSKYDYLFDPYEDYNYSSSMEEYLNKYDWYFPDGWNVYFDACDERNVYDNLDELAKAFTKRNNINFKEEYFFGNPVTITNNKFNKILSIHKKQKKNKKEQKLFSSLYETAKSIADNLIRDFVFDYEEYNVDGDLYFTRYYTSSYNAYEQEIVIDMFSMIRPSILWKVPEFDQAMNKYLERYGGK